MLNSHDRTDALIRDWKRERPDLDTEAMAVVGRIMQLGRGCEAHAQAALKPFGLDYSAFDVLATLRRSGVPFQLSPSQLCEQVLLTSGAMTACLNRLEQAGYVERHRVASDRRALLVRLTPLGRERIDQAAPVRFAEAARFVRTLDSDQRQLLAGLLAQLAAFPGPSDNAKRHPLMTRRHDRANRSEQSQAAEL